MNKESYKKVMEVNMELISIGSYIQSVSENNGGRNYLGGHSIHVFSTTTKMLFSFPWYSSDNSYLVRIMMIEAVLNDHGSIFSH